MYFRYVQNLRVVFISDLGHSSPKVPMLAQELGLLPEVESVFISPKVNNYQNKRFAPFESPNFQFIQFNGLHSDYRRFDYLPRYLSFAIRMSKKLFRFFRRFFFREDSQHGLSWIEIDKWVDELETIHFERNLFCPGTVLISSSSPFISHVATSRLAAKYDLIWIADYRDPWSTNHVKYLENFAEAIDFEKEVLMHSSGIVASSNQLISDLQNLHPGPFEIIHNGFSALAAPLARDFIAPLRMLYVGQIYPRFQEYERFLDALESINSIIVLLEVTFIGASSKDVQKYFLNQNQTLPAYVVLKSEIPISGVSAELASADLLLFFTWNSRLEITTNFPTTVIGSKIYDYIGAQRFIVAFGPNCDEEIDDLLSNTGLGKRVNNSVDLKFLVENFYSSNSFSPTPNLEEIDNYSYRAQAIKLLRFIRRLELQA